MLALVQEKVPVEEVGHLYSEFVDLGPVPFYMHTDREALGHLLTTLQTRYGRKKYPDDFDVTRLTRKQYKHRNEILNELVKPYHIGCHHIALMLQHHDVYHVPIAHIEAFIRSFYSALWEERSGAKQRKWKWNDPRFRQQLEILEGGHDEDSILNILVSDEHVVEVDECVLLQPLVTPWTSYGTAYITTGVEELYHGIRGRLARFFAIRFNIDLRTLLHQANDLSDTHSAFTLSNDASELPEYQVNIIKYSGTRRVTPPHICSSA
eukprot:gene10868-12662_t